MKIIIQDLSDQTTRGLSLAYHITGFPTVLWDSAARPIFDVFYELNPDMICVYSSFYKDNAEELRAAQEKFGGTIFVIGMEFDDKFTFGRLITPSANIVDNITKINDHRFNSDVSMIIDHLRENDIDYVMDIIKIVNDADLTLRIYGGIKIDSPHYCGKIKKSDFPKIYSNSRVNIDLYGEHYLGPFLFGNLGICELQYRFFGESWLNCETLDDLRSRLFQVKQEKISNIDKKVVLDSYTNFDVAASILGAGGFVDQSLKVPEKKKEIINELWTGR